jgi:hypothetical protein
MKITLILKQHYFTLFFWLQMENACREYIFISEFFMVQGQNALDLFQQVLGKTLALMSVKPLV